MTSSKSMLIKGAFAAAVAAGALAATSAPASAEVACNRFNECWHVRDHYRDYPSTLGVIFHDDAWRAAHARGMHWRAERAEHGYYRNGVWVRF
jgi:hypothetical protein